MPTPPALVVGNWKMNTDIAAGVALAKAVADGAASAAGVKLVVCPPFVSLAAVRDAVAGSGVAVGAQNMHADDGGPFTGEIAPPMLAGLCEYVIIGHSERRELFGEKDISVGRKVATALRHGLRPIICVGETELERKNGVGDSRIEQQIKFALYHVSTESASKLTIAYEPTWAINTGVPAHPEGIKDIIRAIIRPVIEKTLGTDAAATIPILYGGSVRPGNASEFAEANGVNGVLVGGSSLNADNFLSIARAFASDQTSVRDLLRRSLLPVMTSIGEAIAHWQKEIDNARHNPDHRTSGEQMIHGLCIIQEALNRFKEWENIVSIGSVGEPFDERLHYSIGQNDSPDYASRTVTEVLEPGYRVDGVVVKQAKVIVNR